MSTWSKCEHLELNSFFFIFVNLIHAICGDLKMLGSGILFTTELANWFESYENDGKRGSH